MAPQIQPTTPHLTFNGTDRKSSFANFSPSLTRALVESGVHGTAMVQNLLGLASAEITNSYRPDSDGAFNVVLLAAFHGSTDLTVVYRPSSAAAGPGNLQATMTVKVSSAPPFSAARGSLIEGQLGFAVNAISITDGTTTWNFESAT